MPSGPRRVDVGAERSAPPAAEGTATCPVRPRGEARPLGTGDAAVERSEPVGPAPDRAPAGPGRAPETETEPATASSASRWRWRHRMRRERPHLYRLYRAGVAVVGGLLLVAWLLVSWLPGPGGIPLLLAALAVLSTEFRWARRLLLRARAWARDLAAWAAQRPAWARVLGSAALAGLVLAGVGLALVLALGLPAWLPEALALQLDRLPGVGPAGGGAG